jgi:hypothetical protein
MGKSVGGEVCAGFGIKQSQLRATDKLSRLILIIAIALYRVVSTGLWDASRKIRRPQKSNVNRRSLLSLLKRGLRAIQVRCKRRFGRPKLWIAWKS